MEARGGLNVTAFSSTSYNQPWPSVEHDPFRVIGYYHLGTATAGRWYFRNSMLRVWSLRGPVCQGPAAAVGNLFRGWEE